MKRVSTVSETVGNDGQGQGQGNGQGNDNNNSTQPKAASSSLSSKAPRKERVATKRSRRPASVEAEAGTVRLVELFDVIFDRHVKATADLVRDFQRRLDDGYTQDELVALPLLAEAQGFSPPDMRKRLQPGWLLRDGSGRYAGGDGLTRNTRNWVGDVLQKADETTIPDELLPLVERFGLVGVMQARGVKHRKATGC
jgi:hypothetical protein